MAKSADAFRTISEVAEWLDTPAHVLRFWESKFSQLKPVKRAGGRRYYRPSDMLLLGGIKKLLHTDGMTIKGVQKLLREQGVKHVSGHSQPLDDLTAAEARESTIEGTADVVTPPPETIEGFQRGELDAKPSHTVDYQDGPAGASGAGDEAKAEPGADAGDEPEDTTASAVAEDLTAGDETEPAPEFHDETEAASEVPSEDEASEHVIEPEPDSEPPPAEESEAEETAAVEPVSEVEPEIQAEPEPEADPASPADPELTTEPEADPGTEPEPESEPDSEPEAESVSAEASESSEEGAATEMAEDDEPQVIMPSFSHRRAEPEFPTDDIAAETSAEPEPAEPEPEAPPAPKPLSVDVPDDPADDLGADPGILSHLSSFSPEVSNDMADRLGQVLARLRGDEGANGPQQDS